MTDAREMADVAVIMPAWRSEAMVGRALASVAAQTFLPREVIVVDDGSDDGTSACAREMADALAPAALKVVRQENAGPGAARNRAIAESSAPVLAFLDADDEWLPDKLEKSLTALADPDVCLVAHDITVYDGANVTDVDCARHLPDGADPFVALFKRGFIATATVVCRRDAVLACGGFDETLLSGQDYELWLSISRFDARRLLLLPDRLTRYHVVPGSVSSKIALRRRCAIRIAKRHAPGLRGRARCPAADLMLRFAIVTAEAILSHCRRREWTGVLRALGVLPVLAFSVVPTFAFRFSKGREVASRRGCPMR